MSNLKEDPKCKECGKKVSELDYYISTAADENVIPAQIAMEDGSYNHKTNQFYCNSCYIKLGMPLGTA
jgi:hypothetical protein